jgi:hypothetical protein
MSYAEETKIPIERSLGEIVWLVRKRGASQFMQFQDVDRIVIQFRIEERVVRFTLRLPTIDQMPTRDGRYSVLSDAQRDARLEQRKRSLARALLLVIRAKLESVECGIESIEEAFLANVVMADGATVYDRIAQPIAIEYETGQPNVAMLPRPKGK